MPFVLQSNTYKVIGVMSGTSLDGVDICYCIFKKFKQKWQFEIVAAETIKYSDEWYVRLQNAHSLSAEGITKLDFEYGHYLGQQISFFISKHRVDADFIASHGHTIFHNPDNGYSLQIGKGAAIAAQTGLPCIADFRSGDVSRGGQGAPLVPVGDKHLFKDYDICLNLGGIANLSYDSPAGKRLAYDICVCNMFLNHLASMAGFEFDQNGELGRNGIVIDDFLNILESLSYYKKSSPKSLGKEWFEKNIIPLINNYHEEPIENLLRTAYEHISKRIAEDSKRLKKKNIFITGGGAKNLFLTELIKQKSNLDVIVPNEKIIDFKEALIFGFLGVLFLEKEKGALASVTGANEDSIAGCLYF
jgi:anhydro-N-acetylmuramic acid kinase